MPTCGSVDPAACDTAFEFGRDGKPLLIGDLGGISFGGSDDDDEDLTIDADDESSEPDAEAPAAITGPDAPGRDNDRAAA
nr:hypothetical protein [uncultured Rhodopila sp.]